MNEENNMAIGMKPADAIKQKFIGGVVKQMTGTGDSPLFQEKVRYLYEGEAESSTTRRATDSIWSTSVHEIKYFISRNPSVYYLWDRPQRSFVKEELQIVPPDTVSQF